MSARRGRWALALTAFLFSSVLAAEPPVALCAACHGADGNSPEPEVPSIAGQPKLFLENQLVLFREELRRSEIMQPVVRGMKDPEIVALAGHFSKLPARSVETGPRDAALAARGAEVAKELRCGVCHLSDYRGQNQVPRLAGQREAYLEREMRAYRDNRRTGGDTIMAATLRGVADADLKALAHYLARHPGKAAPRSRGR